MEIKDLTENDVLAMLNKIWHYPKKIDGLTKLFDGRKYDLLFSKGYDDPRYTTVLFCIKGSPNKLQGWIKETYEKCHVCNNTHTLEVQCNMGGFFFSHGEIYAKVSLGGETRKFVPCAFKRNVHTNKLYPIKPQSSSKLQEEE